MFGGPRFPGLQPRQRRHALVGLMMSIEGSELTNVMQPFSNHLMHAHSLSALGCLHCSRVSTTTRRSSPSLQFLCDPLLLLLCTPLVSSRTVYLLLDPSASGSRPVLILSNRMLS